MRRSKDSERTSRKSSIESKKKKKRTMALASAPTVLADGERATVGGTPYCVSQSLVRTPDNNKETRLTDLALKLVPVLALTAGVVVAALLVPVVRWVVAGVAGAVVCIVLLLFTAMALSDHVKGFVVSRALPSAMAGLHTTMFDVKTELLKGVRGNVLDFGAGDGAHLAYIEAHKDAVESVVALEPIAQLHSAIRKRAAKCSIPVEVFGGFSGDLLKQRGPEQFDFIIVGNVLCEVPHLGRAVRELHDLLKPGGVLYFSEHVTNEAGTLRHKLEHSLNPIWYFTHGGCNIDRTTLKSIQADAPWEDVFAWEIKLPGIVNRFHTGLATKASPS